MSDRLPRPGEIVCVLLRYGPSEGPGYRVATYDPEAADLDGPWVTTDSGAIFFEVTHWMPMPAPPARDEEE